jgi:hypothetical protein
MSRIIRSMVMSTNATTLAMTGIFFFFFSYKKTIMRSFSTLPVARLLGLWQ